MNRGQVRTLASLFNGDPNLTRLTSTQYDDLINRAQEQFVFDTNALWKDAATITTVDGTATYDLPSDFLFERLVMHKGLELKPITRAKLAADNPDDRWDDENGTPKYYVIDPEDAQKKILLYPIPQANDAGANLVLTYYPLPAELTADSSTPLNGYTLLAGYHIALACYAAWLAMGYEIATPEVLSKRAGLLKQYTDKTIEARDYFKNTQRAPIRMTGGRVR